MGLIDRPSTIFAEDDIDQYSNQKELKREPKA